MNNKICPKCKGIAFFDPYFKAYICKECGWESEAISSSHRSEFFVVKKKKHQCWYVRKTCVQVILLFSFYSLIYL